MLLSFLRTRTSSLLLAVGIALMAFALITYLTGRIPASYVHVEGTVISKKFENVRTKSGQYSFTYVPTYFPIIAYTVNGSTYQMQGSGDATQPTDIIIGQKVVVAYDPQNPSHDPKLASDKGPVIAGITLGTVGVILCLIGGYRLTRSRKTPSS